jgi:hypothetical protein
MLKMFGLGEGAAIHQDGAIGWGETMKAGQEEETTVDVSRKQQELQGRLLTGLLYASGKPSSCHTYAHCPLSVMISESWPWEVLPEKTFWNSVIV